MMHAPAGSFNGFLSAGNAAAGRAHLCIIAG
jgi:hypothetical protein